MNVESPDAVVIGGRYQLGAQIGRTGRVASVFEATDLHQNRQVAVKLLDPNLLATPELTERFRSVAQELVAISHPNIVRVFDFGETDRDGTQTPYLVMELLKGGSLRDIIDRGRSLTPSQALVVGLDACRGLDHAHRNGFVHTEVKPANLLFGEDRRLRLADLGVARLTAHANGSDMRSRDLATAQYASPEQAQGKRADAKSDVYSLALLLVHAVSGQLPFAGDTSVATLANRVDRLLPVSADLGPLAAVLEKAGRPNPSDRSSASEFGRSLVAAAANLPRPEPLPLGAQGTSLFDAPPGQETTSELTRFRDATGATIRPDLDSIADRTGSHGIRRGDPATTVLRDSTGAIISEPSMLRDITGGIRREPPTGRDPSGALRRDPTGGTPRPRIMAVDDTGQALRPSDPVNRRPVLTYLLVAIGVLAAGVLGVTAYRKLAVPTFVVPNLAAVDEGAARNQVSSSGWEITVLTERSDSVPQGAVVRTDPAAGVELKKGEPLTMIVSEGPTLSPLPEITGQTTEAAQATVQAAGLALNVIEERYDETIPIGTVISWKITASPTLAAGDEVTKGTLIDAVVSKGPEPRVIPDLTNVVFTDAATLLQALGVTLVRLPEDEFSETIPAGSILRQEFEPGATVERGGSMQVAVSKGPDVVPVPPIGGLTFDEAKAALEAVGFTIAGYTGNYFTGTVSGVRYEGEVVVGLQPVKRGAALNLEFAS